MWRAPRGRPLLRAHAELGIRLIHSGRPAQRAKIEWFLRIVRDQFLLEVDIRGVAELVEMTRLFSAWVEGAWRPLCRRIRPGRISPEYRSGGRGAGGNPSRADEMIQHGRDDPCPQPTCDKSLQGSVTLEAAANSAGLSWPRRTSRGHARPVRCLRRTAGATSGPTRPSRSERRTSQAAEGVESSSL